MKMTDLNRFRFLRSVPIAVLFLLGASGTAPWARATETPAAMLQRAVDEYTAGLETKARSERLVKFSRSQQLFQQAIDGQQASGLQVSPDLWVSLGNAAIQAENVGRAIVAYRRALDIDPSHSQALQNLDYARSTVPDWVRFADPTRLTDTLFFWQAIYSRTQITFAASLCFLIASALLATSLLRGAKLYRTVAVLPLAVWLVLSLSLYAGGRSTISGRSAVVVAEECIMRAADSNSSAARLSQPLPDGAELRLLGTRDRWSEVEVNGRSGWVLSSALELVRP